MRIPFGGSWRDRSETLNPCRFSRGAPIGQSCLDVESQLSCHTLILRPSPITHPTPRLMIFLSARIPRQPGEAFPGAEHSSRPSYLQYLFSRTCPRREFGLQKRRQGIFASKESLKTSIFLNPRPPAFFGSVRLSQETQHILRMFGLRSYQNRVRTDWICLHRDLGSLMQVIV